MSHLSHKLSQSSLKPRLESLDALRGFDLFCLVGLEAVVHALGGAVESPFFSPVMKAFTHVDWVGFSPWDEVMPLFMFMAGVTIPLSRRPQTPGERRHKLWRILKRVVILWLCGMMCQGNLLAFDASRIYVYSNTLQAIAVGYLVAALLYIMVPLRYSIVTGVGLLTIYWAGMELVSVDGFGAGSYEAQSNFAEWVDRICLGRFRDGATLGADGQVVFVPWYDYTWIWSSLTFAVTVIMGVVAGSIVGDKTTTDKRKLSQLCLIGFLCIIVALCLSPVQPIIKRIWTSTMTLLSGGIAFLLLAAFYYAIDVKGSHRCPHWLKVYGTNSLVAYMLMSCINFRCIAESLFFGLQPVLGSWYDVLIAVSCSLIIFGILCLLYDRKWFIKA